MITPDATKKFTQPHLPATILHRSSLIQLLQNALPDDTSSPNMATTCKLILLCSPAGYGKTTLLTDFAKHTTLPCCWYLLDQSDADTYTFISSLVSSIRHQFPQFDKHITSQLEQVIAHEVNHPIYAEQFDQLIGSLITLIQTHIPERFALFLCNYHAVNQSDLINTFMNKLLQQLPDQCVIAIESRAIPWLELVPLLSKRQLLGIGSDILRFTIQDIQALIRLQHITSISEDEIAQITESFDGWIAGILLGTRIGNAQIPSQQYSSETIWGSPAIRTDKKNLLVYIVHEVFKHEVDIYAFLKEISLLPHLTAHLCNALLEISDAEERLNYLERQGLFVTKIDGKSGTPSYTLHPIVGSMIYEDACKQDSERVRYLHHRAANIFYTMKNYNLAIQHALSALEYKLAIHFIVEVTTQSQAVNDEETIAAWIAKIPAEIVDASPDLLFIYANIHLSKRKWIQAQPLLEKAQALIDIPTTSLDNPAASVLLAKILIAQGRIQFNAGEYHKVQLLCQRALTLLPGDSQELRARSHQYLGMASSLLGDCFGGLVQIHRALQLREYNTEVHETAILHGNLANIYSMLGNYDLAKHHSSQALAICNHLGDPQGKINNLISMSIITRNKGALDDSVTMLQDCLALAREKGFIGGEAYALENLGEVYQDQGQLQASLKALGDSLALAGQMKDKMLTNSTLCTLSITYLLMGDPQTAQFLVDQTEIKNTDVVTYEEMVRQLTQGTIYLYQHQYQDAYPYLNAVVAFVQKAGLRSRYIRALIRLASCQVGLQKMAEATHSMQQIVEAIKQYNHSHIMDIELLRLPDLQQAMQTMPTTARLNANDTLSQQQPREHEAASLRGAYQVSKRQKTLRILAFGEPTVLIDDVPITHWRMARSMELYFYLLNCNAPIRKEQIIDALWPDSEENIDQTFRSAIYYLRKAIGDACIKYHRSGLYALDHASLYGQQVWYDIEVFQRRYTEAQHFTDQEDEEAAFKSFQDVIDCYRGSYVQSFYSNWCIRRRDELQSMYINARQQLALLAWKNEQLDECMLHWQHILSIDSCLEEAHYGLMRCYIRQGKRNLALRQYQHYASILQEELSASPGLSIQKLYQRLIEPHK